MDWYIHIYMEKSIDTYKHVYKSQFVSKYFHYVCIFYKHLPSNVHVPVIFFVLKQLYKKACTLVQLESSHSFDKHLRPLSTR